MNKKQKKLINDSLDRSLWAIGLVGVIGMVAVPAAATLYVLAPIFVLGYYGGGAWLRQ